MGIAMDPAPPFASGLRIHESGDRLTVHFRPPRSWGSLVFLVVWLLGWTAGGLAAISSLLTASAGEAAFLLFWLCGWAFGECAAICIVAWQLRGRESLTVTPDELEVRQEIGRFSRTRRYHTVLVRDITAERVPHDEDEKPRKDFCLRVLYGNETVRVGQGMGEREAEYVASVVLSRIRRRSWWSDEDEPQTDNALARAR